MELAQEVLRVSKIKFQQGLGSSLEVVNGESDLKAAQNNYFSALYDVLIAKVDLDKAQGKLIKK
jgi:outer membrane protein TolC